MDLPTGAIPFLCHYRVICFASNCCFSDPSGNH